MPRVAVDDVSLHYEEAGAGPPLLLIHAFPVGRRMWEPQMAALAQRHRVIAYDVRGFGLSDAPRDPASYSQALSVEDAHALLETLGAAPAAVCGLSMGGNIALNLALAYPQTSPSSSSATPAPDRRTPPPSRPAAKSTRRPPTRASSSSSTP
jgi:pimeloyl-ACP methyl ester carboxylesterase